MLEFAVHPHSPGTSSPASRTLSCVAIIPARYQSSRLPGKPLAEILGRPMIEHVYHRAAAAPSISQVIVATDDERIVQAVERFGGIARMTRANHASGSDRLAEVAAGLSCDIVVNVQGDEPRIDPLMIEEAIDPMRRDSIVDIATLRKRITEPKDFLDPNVVKVVVNREDFALYFSRAPIPYLRDTTTRPHPAWLRESWCRLFKHVGLYVYRRDVLLAFAALQPTSLERAESLEQLRALEHGLRIKVIETSYESIGVDTPEDLERVRQLMAADTRA
jgi:3-deoxy-manno-octulosonate cytidylyltransferase (CMP-KDO synthetase)